MDNSTWGKLFLFYMVGITIWLGISNDVVTGTVASGSFQGILIYFFTTPAYVILFVSLLFFNSHGGVVWWKNLLCTAAIIYAADIISFARLSRVAPPADLSTRASIDAIVAQSAITHGVEYGVFWFSYYIIVPIVLVVGSAYLLGWHRFGGAAR